MSRLRHLQDLFEQVCELPHEQQAAFVDRVCSDDAELHAELSDLLASDEVVKDHTARKAVGDLSALLQQGQPDALVGAQVGRYTLKSCVGAGGMGSVYLAERNDGVVRQTVAIKFLGRDLLGDGFRQRFEVEREILAKLDHPNITRLIDAEELPDGTPYYVMDYVEGEPITRYAFNQQLDVDARLKLFVEVAKAVAHAHQALIVHRDIKPGNILVDAQGAPHLLDFGIAKPLAQLGAQTVSMTVTGQRMFSPQQAAPEQLLGGNITVGCDVYGLGCLLYELLTGEPAIPLTGLTATEAEEKILHQLPPAPSQRVLAGEKNDERAAGFGSAKVKSWSKAISGELDSIVLNCLRKLPHERYRSVDDLIADVQAYQAGMPIAAKSSYRWYRTKKFVARHRWAVTAAALTAVALVSSSVITALQSREATLQRDAAESALVQAEQQRDRAQRVTQFLIDAFAAANPGGELGKSVTAKDILDNGARKLQDELEDQPELKAQLLTTIAEAQFALSLVDEAIETSSRAAKYAQMQGVGKRTCYASHRILAQAYVNKNRNSEALKVIPMLQECSSSYVDEFDTIMTEVSVFVRIGKVSAAIENRRRAAAMIDIREIDSERAIRVLTSLAIGLSAEEASVEAVAFAKRANDIYNSSDRAIPASGISVYRALAVTARRFGYWDLALVHSKTGVDLAEDIYGPDSVRRAKALTTYANTLKRAGEVEKSLPHFLEAVRIMEGKNGGEKMNARTYNFNYASALVSAEQYDEAEVLLKELIDLSDPKGPEMKFTFMFRVMLARISVARGDCERARDLEVSAVSDYGAESTSNDFLWFQKVRSSLQEEDTRCNGKD